MSIHFRKVLQPSDPALIYDIVCDTGFFREDESIVARSLVEETLDNPGEYRFVIAEVDGEAAGYICYSEIPCTVGSYELYWLAVYRKNQRQGIGKALIKAAEEDIVSLGGRQIYISTSGIDLYSHTRALYQKAGYDEAAVLKDYYLPGDDQVIYIKKL